MLAIRPLPSGWGLDPAGGAGHPIGRTRTAAIWGPTPPPILSGLRFMVFAVGRAIAASEGESQEEQVPHQKMVAWAGVTDLAVVGWALIAQAALPEEFPPTDAHEAFSITHVQLSCAVLVVMKWAWPQAWLKFDSSVSPG